MRSEMVEMTLADMPKTAGQTLYVMDSVIGKKWSISSFTDGSCCVSVERQHLLNVKKITKAGCTVYGFLFGVQPLIHPRIAIKNEISFPTCPYNHDLIS